MPNIRVTDDRERLSLDDLRLNPGGLIGPGELKLLGVFHSYGAIDRACRCGKLAMPYRLPGGRPRWEGRAILSMLEASAGIMPEVAAD